MLTDPFHTRQSIHLWLRLCPLTHHRKINFSLMKTTRATDQTVIREISSLVKRIETFATTRSTAVKLRPALIRPIRFAILATTA